MSQVVLLAIALAMDAFAVSISMGANESSNYHSQSNSTSQQNANKTNLCKSKQLFKLATMVGLYFGIAQGIMPLIGYMLGSAVIDWLATIAPWIAFVILASLGTKMLVEAFQNQDTYKTSSTVDHKLMLSLSIATSIDALAAGFTLNLLALNAWLACLIIAVITGLFGFFGVYLGYKSGTWLEDKAEVLGGVVLIGIGINMLL